MSQSPPFTFSNPAWTGAIAAQAKGAGYLAQFPKQGRPWVQAALIKRSFPIRHFESWQPALLPTGLPWIAHEPAEEALVGFLDSVGAPVFFRNLAVDHPVTQALLAANPHKRILSRWQRAGLAIAGTFDEWMAQNFDHKRRKELKRLKARLSEQGDLNVNSLKVDSNLAPFLKNFLELEQAGWKGRRGTAVASSESESRALAAGLHAMHQRGHLRFWEMTLSGRPVASLFALVHEGEASLGKIAYDESLAAYSPGVLVIIEATAALFAEEGIRLADSNAMPGHPMIDRLWRGRISAMDVVVGGIGTDERSFNLLCSYLGMKHASRNLAKRVLALAQGKNHAVRPSRR